MIIHRQIIRRERDIVAVRDRARTICSELGFGTKERLEVTTSVFELARNILEHGIRGRITFELQSEGDRLTLIVIGTDKGPGMSPDAIAEITSGDEIPPKGSLQGFVAMRRLMDDIEIGTAPDGGLEVKLVKHRAGPAKKLATNLVEFLSEKFKTSKAPTANEELRLQNANLAQTLSLYEEKTQELERRNRELQELKHELEKEKEELKGHTVELQENLLGLGDETVELSQANQRLYAAVQLLPIPLAITDTDGTVVFENETLAALLKQSNKNLLNASAKELIQMLSECLPEIVDEPGRQQWMRNTLAKLKEELPLDFTISSKEGNVHVRVVPLHQPDGAWLGYSWTFARCDGQ